MRSDATENDRNEPSQRRRADVIAALEEVWSREKARLITTIPPEAAMKLKQFLMEKGLPERQGVETLIQYGLSEESEEELEKLKKEKESRMNRMWHTYATMKFQAYEYFMENGLLTRRLPYSLSKNHSLKKQLENMGLQSLISRDEWDNWNEAMVDRYFRRYVFRSSL